MKSRKGFKQVVVNGKTFKYALSFGDQNPRGLSILYGEDGVRMTINVSTFSNISGNTWRGKYGDKCFGKREVSEIIKKWII